MPEKPASSSRPSSACTSKWHATERNRGTDYAARPRVLPRTEEQYYHLLGETTAAIERPKLEKQEIGQTR